ncbi:alpha-2-macroglobulin family protein [Alishewanella sp. d11]|uniref:alpha-2-macroglobulin family protein n=1 Tax=Alishewanella sp. d11 TaxID=3414030 RepID=UPI003BF77575
MSAAPSFFSRIFGQLTWSAPAWLTTLLQYARVKPMAFVINAALAVLILAASIWAVQYFRQLPVSPKVYAELTPPVLGEYREGKEQATPLTLRFHYPQDDTLVLDSQPTPRIMPGSEPILPVGPTSFLSAAKLALVGEKLPVGETLKPAISGSWQWLDDNTLQFIPDSAWPAGQSYQVNLPKDWFAAGLPLASRRWQFVSPELTAQVQDLRLHQDPEQLSVRKVLATLAFSHPVTEHSVRAALTLRLPETGARAGAVTKPLSYSLQAAEQDRLWYLQTEAISLPEQEQFLTLQLAAGVSAAEGTGKTLTAQEQQLRIPDGASVLQVSSTQIQLVRNNQEEPEQVLQLSLTERVRYADLAQHLTLYLLPEKANKRSWSAAELTTANLQQAAQLTYQLAPGAFAHAQDFAIKLDLPVGRQLAVVLAAGLPGLDQYQLTKTFQSVLSLPEYPKEARISGEGAVLLLSGEQKLQLISRGVPQLKVRLGKVLPQHLNHLISQTGGDISNPFFYNYSFGPENLADITEQLLTANTSKPQQNQFLSLDLKPHLQRAGMGVYFIELYQHNPEYPDWRGELLDKRLVMVTDLGLMVKHHNDSSQRVFVMSLVSGEPVAGAEVQLLGRNGLPVMTAKTDAQGQAQLGVTQGLQGAQQPVVYLVRYAKNGQTDSTFIPYDRYSRQLDFSRFAVDGEYQSSQPDQLKAFLFSDRGIYRPGELVRLASIIRRSDLDPVNAAKLSLQLTVIGPRGNTVQQQKFSLSARGLQTFSLNTEQYSETGQYTASIQLLDAKGRTQQYLGEVTFMVEEFLPDTLKISSQFNQQATGWLTPEALALNVQLDNLFGSAAQQRRVTARYMLIPSAFHFAQYPDYHFGLKNADNLVRQRDNLAEQQTDSAGQVSFDLPLQRFSAGQWRLQLYIDGFDGAGGRAVQHGNAALVAASPFLIGVKADGDLGFLQQAQRRQVHFIAIDQQLALQPQNALTLKLVQKNPLSSLVKQADGSLQYQTVLQQKTLSEQPFAIPEQGIHYSLNTAEPGEYQLQLLNAEGELLSQTDYTVVGTANLTAKLEQNAQLQLTLSKTDYEVGEWLEFSVTAPYTGTGLVTIETDKVEAFSWFKADSSHSVQRIQVPQGLQGNAYLNVSFVRAAGAPELLLSPLSYAVQPFNIARSARELTLNLQAPELVRPGKDFSIQLNSNQPADVLLYGVDLGILQVAEYELPDPLGFFLQKRALQVRSMQMLDLVLPEFSALQRLRAGIGGDRERMLVAGAMLDANLNPFARRVDQPGVFWLGVVQTDSEGTVHQARLPETFTGAVKLMAVAVSEQALGATSQDLRVRGPFVLQPDVLTAVAPGDEFEISLSVANMLEGSGDALGLSVTTTVSDGLSLMSASSQSITLAEGSEQALRMRLKAADLQGDAKPGEASIRFQVSTADGRESASRELSLSIRPAQPYLRKLTFGYSARGEQSIATTPLLPVLAERQLTAGSSPLLLVDRLSHYLDTYPHGCTEQMVSQVFPWIPLVQQPHFQAQWPQLNEKFAKLLQVLAERQQNDGGFAFWPGQVQSADFPSVYVTQFLIAAEQQGFAVPHYLLDRALAYLRGLTRLAGASLYQARLRAQAIYLLSVKGEQVTNALTSLHERLEQQHQSRWQSDITAVYMAASYQLLQQPALAESLIRNYRTNTQSQLAREYQPLTPALPPFANTQFQSQFNLDSQYLYLLSRHFPERAKQLSSEQLLAQLKPLFAGEYHTQAAAYSILALSAYGALTAEANQALPQLLADGQLLALIDNLPYASARSQEAHSQLAIKADFPLFYALSEQGYAAALPTQPIAEGLELQRDYLDDAGNKVTRMQQGQVLTVQLRIRSLGKDTVPNVVITDLLPAGFEVVRSSVPRQTDLWRADYVDIREDRLIWYGSVSPQITELSYQVRVSAAGEFTLPVAAAEAMYDSRIRAQTAAGKLTVAAYQLTAAD